MVFKLSKRKGEARRPTTGKRKGKVMETDENVHAAPSQSRPCPRPIRKPQQQLPDRVENNAALALLAMRTGEPAEPLQDKQQVMQAQPADHVFARVFNIPVDEVLDDFEAYDKVVGDGEGESEEDDGGEDLEEEKDELDDDNDGDEELPLFSIPMEVPYGKKGTRNLAGITSKTSFDMLLEKIADKMETRLADLSDLGFIPSYKPKTPKPKPKFLDEETWESLKSEVHGYIEEQKASKTRGKPRGVVKAFHISIINLSDDDDGKEKGSKKVWRASVPVDVLIDYGDLKAKPDKPESQGCFPQQEHVLMNELARKYNCATHEGKSCHVLANGSHYHYTPQDLSTWAFLLTRHKATIDTPPAELKLDDKVAKTGRQNVVKGVATTVQSNDMMLADASNPLTPILGMLAGFAAALRTPQPPTSPPTHSHKRSASALALLDYPRLSDWLPSLDSHPIFGRNRDNFAQYLPIFEAEKLYDLGDLLALSTDSLRLLTRMEIGPAGRLLRLANAELETLIETKRSRYF
ncbi:hypothetical protein IMY05_C4459000200 [Salix suchowensis]|nr:hypothetical protein IMY05_C4459000200 [Salix suchowensis]